MSARRCHGELVPVGAGQRAHPHDPHRRPDRRCLLRLGPPFVGSRRLAAFQRTGQVAGSSYRVEDPATRSIRDQLPGTDVLALLTAEARFELSQAVLVGAPHVVALIATLARRPDGLPLEQVVGTAARPGLRGGSVELDDAPATGKQHERSHGLTARGTSEQQPCVTIGVELPIDGAKRGPGLESDAAGGFEIDPLEVAHACRAGILGTEARATGLVHRPPRAGAQAGPKRLLRQREVDHPRAVDLDGRDASPAGGLQPALGRMTDRQLRVDHQVGEPQTSRRRPDRGGEVSDARSVEVVGQGSARRVPARPRAGPHAMDQDLGADDARSAAQCDA